MTELLISLVFERGWDKLPTKIYLPKAQNPSIASIGPEYLGGVVGNWYLYQLTGVLYGNGTSRDSIFSVEPAITPYCGTQNVAFRVEKIVSDSFPSGRYDTTFQYVRNDSAADYGGIIVYKILQNTWQGIDTCVVLLNTPYPIPSVDDDAIPDTVWYRSSPGNLISKNADTVYSRVEIRYKVKTTSTISGFPMDSILAYDRYKFRFRENYGFWLIKLDTSYVVFYITGFGAFPTTLANVYTKTLLQSNVSIPESNLSYKIINNTIYFDRTYKGYIYIYKPDGRMYKSIFLNGKSLDLSSYKGLYIIKLGQNYIKFINR
jgi:hypothetical protein